MTPARKNSRALSLIGVAMTAFLARCHIEAGTGSTNKVYPATIGQQLLDLKNKRDSGAMNEQEYEAQKTKLLNQN